MTETSSLVGSRTTLEFHGRRAETDEILQALPAESQAALRQFSVDRLLGYGLAYADVVELRSAVLGGAAWQAAAVALAVTAEARARSNSGRAAAPTRIAFLRRASGLLRMSQMMMLTDTDERRDLFAQAASLYGEAAELAGDRERVTIESETGPVVGWLHPAAGRAVGSAVVIGGVEGWAMDFASLGVALAARGIDALMLDGPGQGETRFAHSHYLSAQWPAAYRAAIDHLVAREPGNPIGFIGNSMGGSFAIAVAGQDVRIRACCDNGGVTRPILARGPSTFFGKMMAACGTDDEQSAADAWETVDPLAPGHGVEFPLLVVHGGRDLLVSTPGVEALFAGAPTGAKELVVFSDGDHCIYNHIDDRDALIADWMRSRLAP